MIRSATDMLLIFILSCLAPCLAQNLPKPTGSLNKPSALELQKWKPSALFFDNISSMGQKANRIPTSNYQTGKQVSLVNLLQYLINTLETRVASNQNVKRSTDSGWLSNKFWENLHGLSKSDQNTIIGHYLGLSWMKRSNNKGTSNKIPLAREYNDTKPKSMFGMHAKSKSRAKRSNREKTNYELLEGESRVSKRHSGFRPKEDSPISGQKRSYPNLSSVLGTRLEYPGHNTDLANKHVLGDMDYSFLWSLFMNQYNPEARQLLDAYAQT